MKGDAAISKDPGIRNVRKTVNGDMLVEFSRDSTDRLKVRNSIAKSLGEEVLAILLAATSWIAVRDLEELVDKNEVGEALATQFGVKVAKITVERLFPTSRGTQIAVVKLPTGRVLGVIRTGRVKVSFVSCRVREWANVKTCFSCLVDGHIANNCTGADRSALCSRCGSPSHKRTDCAAGEEERAAFRALLAAKPA